MITTQRPSPIAAGRAANSTPLTRDISEQRLLNISATAGDHNALCRILNGSGWDIVTLGTCRAATEQMRRSGFAAVICEYKLEDGSWKDILEQINRSADPVPLIVSSLVADGYMWAEVLNLGGYDVLAKPFDGKEVRHVLTCATNHPAHKALRAMSASGAA